ncbi:MAG TPA: hypothetical protein VGP22_10895 [Albitalea sp.]|jgi:hypothetical protein|nr:hypothetical protein [Albitalea sp.]
MNGDRTGGLRRKCVALACALTWSVLASVCAAAVPDDPPIPDLPPIDESETQPGAAGAAESRQGGRSGVELQLWWQQIDDHAFSASGPSLAHSEVVRVALDLRMQWQPTATLQTGWSSRLDLASAVARDAGAVDHDQDLHSLREVWLSWRNEQANRVVFVDAGRINWRLGSGGGYNPTDFFKTGAARAVSNADPRATRLDRLGVVMLRAQAVTSAGSLTAALAPRLSRRQDIDERLFALALERTNGAAAALVKWSPQWSEAASLDGSLFLRESQSPQLGLSFSGLVSPSLVLHAEWAGGRRTTLGAPGQTATAPAWRNRLATGGTWTAAAGWDLLLEVQYAGDALSREAWEQWRNVQTPLELQQLGQLAQQRAYERDPLTRTGLFARASWRNAFDLRQLSLYGFVQANPSDPSLLWQLRGDWRLNPTWSLVGMAGGAEGAVNSEFGNYNPRRHLSVYVAHFY